MSVLPFVLSAEIDLHESKNKVVDGLRFDLLDIGPPNLSTFTLQPRRPELFSPAQLGDYEIPLESLAPGLYLPSLRGSTTVPGKVPSLAVEMTDAVLKLVDKFEQVFRQKKDNQGLPSREKVIKIFQDHFLYFTIESPIKSTLTGCSNGRSNFIQYYIKTVNRLRSTSDVSEKLTIYEDYHRQVEEQIVPLFLTYVNWNIREEEARVLRHPLRRD